MATIKDWTLGILVKAKDEATGIFGGVTGALKGMAAAAAAYAGFDLFRDAISGAADFEAAMDKVIAKTDDGRENAAQLAEAARRIGPEFGASATEAAQGLEILGAAGLKADDAIKTLPAVLALAKSEGIGLEQAAGLVTNSLSIMGLGFEDAGRAADVLTKAANLSNLSAVDAGEALKFAGGEARTAGLSLEQTAAILDALAQNGIKGSEAGTALRSVLAQLGDPASKARQELLGLGVSTGNLTEALDAVRDAGPRGEAAIRAFGLEAGPGMRALLKEGSDGIASYETQLLAAGGTAKATAEQVGGNLTGALNALSAIWEVVSQQLLEPILEPLANGLRSLAANLREFAKNGLGELQSSVGSVIDKVKTTTSGLVENFNTAFESIKTAVAAFIGSFQLDTVKDDLSGVGTSVTGLADTISNKLPSATTVGVTAASSLSAAWNGAASVLYTVSAGINKLLEYSTKFLATVEEQAAKVGLGSQERADALRRSAEEYAATAVDMAEKGTKSYEQVKAALERLQAGITSLDEAEKQASENRRLSADTYLDFAAKAENAAGKVEVLKAGYRELTQAGKDTTAIEQALAAAFISTDQAATDASQATKELADTQQVAAEAAKESAAAQTQADEQVLDKKTQVLNATKDTVARLQQEYESLKASGTASAVEISLAFSRLQTAQRYLAQQTGETSKEIVAAFERLGIESAKSLKAVADSARTDFQTIRQSGAASVGELNAAFAAMAAKALEAAAAVSPLAVEIEKNKLSILAGTEAQRQALAELVKKYQEVQKTAADAGATQTKAAEETAEVVDKTTDAIAQQAAAAEKAAKSMEGVKLATVRVGSEMAAAFGDQLPRYNSLVAQIQRWMEGAADAATALSEAVQSGSVADYGPLLFAARDLEGSFQKSSGYMDTTVARIRDDLVRAIQDATAAMREFANEQARAAEEEALDLERQLAAGNERRLAEIDHREKLIELQKLLAEAEAITDTAARLRAIEAVQERIRLENERHRLVMQNMQSEEAAQRTPSNPQNPERRSERTVRFRLQTDQGESIINTDQSGANALDEFFARLDTARRRAA